MRPAKTTEGLRSSRVFCCALFLLCVVGATNQVSAEEVTARIRLAWGSRGDSLQRWTGEIACAEGTLSDLQPLGIEADEAAALRLESDRLIVSPLVKRRYDGCDLTVRADREAIVSVRLRSEQSPEVREIRIALGSILEQQFSEPLDDLGSFFLVHRSPGDKLRVVPTTDSMVFSPGESWTLRLQPDLATETAAGPVMLNLYLSALGDQTKLWQASQQVSAASAQELLFDINCPATESVYRVTIEARAQPGFTDRFVPWQQAEVFAKREIEFVVVDPQAKLPTLVDQWQEVLTIDPANPKWWQRLPRWAQVSRLTGRPTNSVGNVRPVVRPMAAGEIVELPAQGGEPEPFWQSYTLPVQDVGVPHVVEVEYPTATRQHLSICVVEPDAAGRVTKPSADSGIYTTETHEHLDGQTSLCRIVFWPRTQSPQLLLVNRDRELPAQFGKLRLSKQLSTPPVDSSPKPAGSNARLIAGYISLPTLASQFGAAQTLDPESGLSVDGWQTFLAAANRYAQYLKLSGQNGAIVTVAAEGSALYPSQLLNPSPKYDTGIQATAAQDPIRKDVLELLLRVFDREGLQLVPALQLATPLPRLERVRASSDPQIDGIELVNHSGLTWQQHFETPDGHGVHYNPLNAQVQGELLNLTTELAKRYRHHRSLRGVAIQLSGTGYSTLPGLTWGLDDRTIAAFEEATGVVLGAKQESRFVERARSLLGPHRQQWRNWRTNQMVEFYRRNAAELGSIRADLELMLTTEQVFAGSPQRQRLRESLSTPAQLSEILLDHGLDLVQLQKIPQLTVLNSYSLSASDELQQKALQLRQNAAAEHGELLPAEAAGAALTHYQSTPLRLTSFDENSPFAAEKTFLTLSGVSVPDEFTARKQLVAELARGEIETFALGGSLQPLVLNSSLKNTFRVLGQLPTKDAEIRTYDNQPVLVKVYRRENQTVLLLCNRSKWPTETTIALEAPANCTYSSLAEQSETDSDENELVRGVLDPGNHSWSLSLEPYDIRAWVFDSSQLRIDEPQTTSSQLATVQLQRVIDDIASRAGNLEIKRPYQALLNPGFETLGQDERIFGWQSRSTNPQDVELVQDRSRSGSASLSLRGNATQGTSVESNSFLMPPTGQLTLGVFVQAADVQPDTRLYVEVQDARAGHHYQQYATIPLEPQTENAWPHYEFLSTTSRSIPRDV